MDERLNDPKWLRTEYASKSLQAIADSLGCHRNTVRKRMVKLGIERQGRGEHLRGKPKPVEQRERMSASRQRYWDARPDRTMFKLKVSQAMRKNGTRCGRPYLYVIGRGYVAEHTIVAENKIGRRLNKGEHVHHKDGDITNNDPSNLDVLTATEHARAHAKQRTKQGVQGFIDDVQRGS